MASLLSPISKYGPGKFGLYLSAGITFYSSLSFFNKERRFIRHPETRCCGIFGYIGNESALPVLMEGITILQNRGYDSCGISSLNEKNEIITTKFSSSEDDQNCVEKLFAVAPFRHSNHTIGIAHTRWATHGGKTDTNSHPHHDYKNRVSLIHNGIIDNYSKLKAFLLGKGIPFKSETDSEVISNLIGYYLDNSHTVESAVKHTIQALEGTWGLCILPNQSERKLIVATHGSPIVVGKAENNRVYVSSEPSGLALFTKEFIALNDGGVFEITQKGIDNLLFDCITYKIDNSSMSKDPSPFSHWTIKEIFEQPESLRRSQNFGGRLGNSFKDVKLGGLENEKDVLKSLDSISLVGCGTSLHAAMFAQYFFNELELFNSVHTIDSCEFDVSILPRSRNLGMILISQSGETLDTLQVFKNSKNHIKKHLSVVNVVGSQLARFSGCGVYLNAGYEFAVASTKSFSSQVSILCMIALWFYNHQLQPKFTRAQTHEDLSKHDHDLNITPSPNNSHTHLKQGDHKSVHYLNNSRNDNNGTNHEVTSHNNGKNPTDSENNQNDHPIETKSYFSKTTQNKLKHFTTPPEKLYRKVPPDYTPPQKLHDALKELPNAIEQLLQTDFTKKCEDISNKIKSADTLFILGSGLCFPIALEGALKMKEMSYIHAEGFSGSALKHGPFAIIDPNKKTPIIFLVQNDSRLNKMLSAIQQVKSRGAFVVCISTSDTPLDLELIDASVIVNSSNVLTPLIFNLALQLISYYTAISKGINPDKPRGLAKTVTVQ